MKVNKPLTHFTDKVWLITWERQGGGFGCWQYGVHSFHNKPNLAQNALDKLVQAENKKAFYNRKTSYLIQEVSLNESKQLFEFNY